MPDRLLKRWNDWSGGVGHPIDEGGPGMHTANKLLGLRGELRPAPVATDVTIGADYGQHYQYFFEEPITTSAPIYDAASTDTTSAGTTLDLSHTVADKPNRILVVFVMMTGVTVPDVSFTYQKGTAGTTTSLSIRSFAFAGGNAATVAMYYGIDPTAGAGNTITITWASSVTSAVGIASTWYNVDQTAPFGASATGQGTADPGPVRATATSRSGEVVIAGGLVTDSVQTMTVVDETQIDNQTIDDIRGASSYEAGAASVNMDWTVGGGPANVDWAAIATPLLGVATNYLYAQRGNKSGTSWPVIVDKISLGDNDFANLETGNHSLTPLTVPGQPVRYQGYWWFPMGDNQKARRLQTVGVGAVANDTLDATATALGADHFANLDDQVVASLVHSGNDDGGLRILKVAGDIGTEADWGPAFAVGDRTERAAGLRALAGLCFQLNIDGLYAFNKRANARLIFEDFRAWRHVFDNIAIVPWKGYLAFSHPTGLLLWKPGEPPVNIGLNADIGSSVLSPSGPAGLRGGRYHGLSAAGDFLYTIYQPDINSTTANVMVGYPREQDPRDLIWQQLGTTTLQDSDHMLGCFVSVGSKPLSSAYVTPTLWYGNDNDLSYVVLGTTASPFRTRADTHAVETAGDAYMSELLFEEPTPLSRMVVYAQNMSTGDEWQLKLIADGEEEKNLGPPIKANGRHEIKIDRHDVYRLMLHVNWASSVTTARVAPSIQRIELYGPER